MEDDTPLAENGEVLDLFGQMRSMPPTTRRVVAVGATIMQEAPDRADFLHAILCQVGMPRKATPGRVFERSSGGASMMLEAGKLWTGRTWREVPLPYGTRPRLVMVHVSSEAVRTRSREIHIGDSMKDFLIALGIDTNGGPRGGYTMFKRQMEALAASRLTLGFTGGGRAVTLDAKPISRFEAWLHPSGEQRPLWPGLLELSQEFFDTLAAHAVPLDHRALGALKHSALSLDLYTWLAHRLCRVRKPGGVKLSWENLREQFGQEYADPKNFKKEFRQAIRPALAVYPDARVEEVAGGILLRPSQPPMPKTQVAVLA
jgi:hypothetical protein